MYVHINGGQYHNTFGTIDHIFRYTSFELQEIPQRVFLKFSRMCVIEKNVDQVYVV